MTDLDHPSLGLEIMATEASNRQIAHIQQLDDIMFKYLGFYETLDWTLKFMKDYERKHHVK